MIHSLRFRLAVGAIIAIALSMVLVWSFLSRLFTDYVVDRYRGEMIVLADSLAAGASVQEGKFVLSARPSDPRLSLPAGGRYWQIERMGMPPLRSRSLWDTTIDPAALKPFGNTGLTTTLGPDGEPILVFEQKSTLGEGTEARSFVIHAAFAKAELDIGLKSFHAELSWMLVFTALLLAAAALIQAMIGLTPLNRLRRKVAEVRSGQRATLGDDGPSEVKPLVREINLLLEERETAVGRARARASDLAHGLKTPLTVLSQLSQKLSPEDAKMALRQVDVIRQRADRQLQAARLGVEQMATTDLGALTGKLIAVLKPVTEPRGIAWQIDMGQRLIVNADPADLAEAIGNVLDNAGKWARAAIAVSVRRDGATVSVTVGDDGPGVAQDDYARILTRGVHADDDSGGHGLGLAIVRDIAEAYGATLGFGRSPLGGLEARLAFAVNPRRRPEKSG